MNRYRDLSPEEKWEITDNLTSQDIMNGMVDHYLNDNTFWRDIEYEHPDLISFLDNRLAIIDKKYGLEKLHQLSKKHPNKKLQQAIMWHNYENTNENKNMAKNKIRITENELKQIVAESVKNILFERTKSEKGLTDDEVSRSRTLKFANNVNPEYSDSIYNDEQDNYMDKMYARRKQHHNATQNHQSSNLDEEQLMEFKRAKKPLRGVIEWEDGKFIPAVEDGVDRYGNVMYKVKDLSIKGRRCKDGSIRVQSFRFWPDKE